MRKNKLLLQNIGQLHRVGSQGEGRRSGADMRDTQVLENTSILIEGDEITAIGPWREITAEHDDFFTLNCTGSLVLPGFVDSHTHLVYARSREGEYVDRIRGLSYEEIARRGGGILNSARRLQEMSEEQLLVGALERAWEILGLGTTTVEIKSGYGLTTEDELKMLRVAKQVRELTPLRVKTTFLGAHAIPQKYKDRREDYIRLVIEEMIPQVAEAQLAEYVDVFCDEGFFTVEETARILEAGISHGMVPKIHANEIANSGGVQVGIAHGALSVDHLERTGPAEIEALANSQTIPTVLPGVSFFLGIDWAPARQMIDAGLPLCIASDYNPGSSPCGSLPFMQSLACTRMGLLPEEALTACTLNGAAALGLEKDVGSIEVGKKADLVITKPMESLARFPYYHTQNQIQSVIAGGKPFRIETGPREFGLNGFIANANF